MQPQPASFDALSCVLGEGATKNGVSGKISGSICMPSPYTIIAGDCLPRGVRARWPQQLSEVRETSEPGYADEKAPVTYFMRNAYAVGNNGRLSVDSE